ncbi:hypothetical protein E2C01_026467 [Portunus trituberculatus]|uniref:Uncharacterized protein n=1 Tax=Portunus trituberculatus TaxID=210409 RepID=A0A5B7EI86_PORTR|nr:hypothetical protein [Portunus trituberculatus]
MNSAQMSPLQCQNSEENKGDFETGYGAWLAWPIVATSCQQTQAATPAIISRYSQKGYRRGTVLGSYTVLQCKEGS